MHPRDGSSARGVSKLAVQRCRRRREHRRGRARHRRDRGARRLDPGAQPRRALPVRGAAGRGRLGARRTRSPSRSRACSRSTSSSSSRCTRSRSPTRATGSRCSCSSSRRSSSPSSPTRSRRRAREAALLAEIATSLLEHGTVAAELERDLGRGGAGAARRAAPRSRSATSRGDGFALTAGGRRVGTIQRRGRRLDASARRRVLPALASLLGVAIDRERLAARGARGRGAAPRRRDQDRAPPRRSATTCARR